MQHASKQLEQPTINELKTVTSVFKHTPEELLKMAIGMSAGLALAGLKCPMLDLAISSDNIPLMIQGGLLSD
jgi:hypothetical protein